MSNVNALLNSFLGENKGTNNSVSEVFNIVNSARKATAQQKFTYEKLCADKNIEVNAMYTTWDYETLAKEINKVMAMKRVQAISEGQKTTIIDVCERNGWEVPSLSGLTGGREGSASKLIQELFDLEKTYNNNRPLTEAQKEMILDMYYCPDVLFEDLHEDFGTQSLTVDGRVYWTRIDIDRMNIELEGKVTQTQAREFLNKYKGAFYDWKTTRLTETQMHRIQGLQERSYMEQMSDTKLLQFSKKDAERYIMMLESSLRDRDLTKFTKEPVMHTKMDEVSKDRIRTANNMNMQLANEVYLGKVESLIHSLYASMGQSARDENIDSMKQDDVKELIDLASEMNGKQAILELAGEILTAHEVEEIFGEDLDEVALTSEEDEYTKAESLCEEIIKMAMSSPLDVKKKAKTYKLAVQRIFDKGLVSEELFENMQMVFKKIGA